MADINLDIAVREEDILLFKRCIRRLLESTFILREKDEKFYRFAIRESNRQNICEYLRMIGFDMIVDENAGVCMLAANETDAEAVGLKRANAVTFTPLQYHLLLVLWEVYLENLGTNEGNYTTKGDLIDKIRSYDVSVTRTELNTAFRLFRKYSLIDFNDSESGEDMKIKLYPSLQFGWDVPQFQAVTEEYLKREQEDSSETDTEDSVDFEEENI